ncbi:MAG: ATP-dependent Clp protease adaptor ClpS [Arachnia sp.]
MTLATPEVDVTTDTSTEEAPDTPWKTMLHNDDVNVFPFVVKTLQLVLKEEQEVCEEYAHEAHTNGSASVFDGKKSEAEQKATQLQAAGLWATIEKA